MLKIPVARYWRGDTFDEYKDRLRELVPVWPELNDALFWRSVEEKRAQLAKKKSKRLTDDWQLQWIGHLWSFGPERFHDVLEFVRNSTLEDDQLVALSLAYRLYAQAGNLSDWLNDLTRTVQGYPILEERLDALINPPISQSASEWQEEERKRSEKREVSIHVQKCTRIGWTNS